MVARADPSDKKNIILYASDDLVQRAENIVYLLGYRGAIGGYVLDVHNLLRTYAELDRPPTPLLHQRTTRPLSHSSQRLSAAASSLAFSRRPQERQCSASMRGASDISCGTPGSRGVRYFGGGRQAAR